MGQYYKVTTEYDGKFSYWSMQSAIFKESGDIKDYMPVKLMEHSWLHNSLTDFFSSLIYKSPHKVAWIGDYVDEDEVPEGWITSNPECREEYNLVEKFDYTGLALINHDKAEYVVFDSLPESECGMIVYPLSLLTAIGNGRGNGDYYDVINKYVGSWATNLVEIVPVNEVPEEYTEIHPNFKE